MGGRRPPYYYSARLGEGLSHQRVSHQLLRRLFSTSYRFSPCTAKMGFCSCTVKYLLFIFNFVFVLGGLALIVLGVLAHKGGDSFKQALQGEITITSITLIVIGAIVFIIAFFGCCGAIRESSCMVTTYAIFLLAILIIQVAIGAIAFVYKGKIADNYKVGLNQLFDDYNTDKVAKEAVDDIQKTSECCGLNGPSFWTTNIPKSCCKPQSKSDDNYPNCSYWADGCLDKTEAQIKESLKQLGALAIGVALIEVFGVVFSLCLASSIRRQEKRGYV